LFQDDSNNQIETASFFVAASEHDFVSIPEMI
jgi:hypothetical protein